MMDLLSQLRIDAFMRFMLPINEIMNINEIIIINEINLEFITIKS